MVPNVGRGLGIVFGEEAALGVPVARIETLRCAAHKFDAEPDKELGREAVVEQADGVRCLPKI